MYLNEYVIFYMIILKCEICRKPGIFWTDTGHGLPTGLQLSNPNDRSQLGMFIYRPIIQKNSENKIKSCNLF